MQEGRADATSPDKPSGWQQFMTSQEPPYPVARDVAVGAVAILLVLSSLWLYTGRWGHSPVVVVESGSMMHCANGTGVGHDLGRECTPEHYGRLGTIDPGDLILVQKASGRTEVGTLAAGGQHHYGRSGDVIVYLRNGDARQTPVIHRALFWVQMNADGTFDVPEFGITHASSLDDARLQGLGLPAGYAGNMQDHQLDSICGVPGPARSGFITRGDNNPSTDQQDNVHVAISLCPIKESWIVGKARGEVPWLGLVKLLFSDLVSHLGPAPTQNYHNAGSDSKALLWLVLIVLIGGPYVYEKMRSGKSPGQPPAPPPPAPPNN